MLVNKVAQSGLVVLDLEDHYPEDGVVSFDISALLFRGLILREQEFRDQLKATSPDPYRGKVVAVWCSTDAIVPQWAYMLVTAWLHPVAEEIQFGKPTDVEELLLTRSLEALNIEAYRDKRVIIKGCGRLERSGRPYITITKRLLPVVRSLMFGEPCSTVPVYKRK